HGSLVAKAPVQVVGVVEELLGERIELHRGRRDGHDGSSGFGRGATVTDGIERLAPARSKASTTDTRSSTAIMLPLRRPRSSQAGASSAARARSHSSMNSVRESPSPPPQSPTPSRGTPIAGAATPP